MRCILMHIHRYDNCYGILYIHVCTVYIGYIFSFGMMYVSSQSDRNLRNCEWLLIYFYI